MLCKENTCILIVKWFAFWTIMNLQLKSFCKYRFLAWSGCILMRWRYVSDFQCHYESSYEWNAPENINHVWGVRVEGIWVGYTYSLLLFADKEKRFCFSCVLILKISNLFIYLYKINFDILWFAGHSRGSCWANCCCIWCWLCIRFYTLLIHACMHFLNSICWLFSCLGEMCAKNLVQGREVFPESHE